MSSQRIQPPALLFIEGDLTIRRVQEMKDVLLARLAQSQALEVDLKASWLSLPST